ncbi:MAG: exodeoxyribonuclease VII large subunit [Spirochaetes bacterium]|nr:exodeoxyribonuclease VII large subunit [Spirochaetota bacterium]
MAQSSSGDKEYIFTVAALVREVKETLEGRYNSIAVVGEISRIVIGQSGHAYFDLKDEHAVVSCVMFASSLRRLQFRPEEGIRVVVYGRATMYDKRGQFQLNLTDMRPEGAGALAIAFEQLKKKLMGMGYFDAARKRVLPKYPRAVGIVTSPDAAALHDMLKVSRRRAPSIDIIIYPTLVQGRTAADNIAGMLKLANERREVDVIITGRGGGSIEDLWAFNEEVVAEAIFMSDIPVVSAVGHETDVTIADFVADVRAATPSQAAELVFPDLASAAQLVLSAHKRMLISIENRIGMLRERFLRADKQQLKKIFKRRIDEAHVELDHLSTALSRGMERAIVRAREHRSMLVGKLELLNPLGVLKRGYAIASQNGTILKSVADVDRNTSVDIRLHDGTIRTTPSEKA